METRRASAPLTNTSPPFVRLTSIRRYAALDAFVPPLIIEKLLERHPELKDGGLLSRCSSVTL